MKKRKIGRRQMIEFIVDRTIRSSRLPEEPEVRFKLALAVRERFSDWLSDVDDCKVCELYNDYVEELFAELRKKLEERVDEDEKFKILCLEEEDETADRLRETLGKLDDKIIERVYTGLLVEEL